MLCGALGGRHDLPVQNFYRGRRRILDIQEAALLFHFHHKGDLFALAAADLPAGLDGVVGQVGQHDHKMLVLQPKAGQVAQLEQKRDPPGPRKMVFLA